MNLERMTTEQIKASIIEKLGDNFGCGLSDATEQQLYMALALTVRDEVMQRRKASRGVRKRQRAKKVYYLSAEFLVGRALHNNMVNLVNENNYLKALKDLGIDRDVVFELEPEPGLGNGGLGRLAACFLDSLTTLQLPAMGCTIRYEYGLFRQKLVDGYQVEVPDNWLEAGNIWEIPRPDQMEKIEFGGHLEEYREDGRLKFRLLDSTMIEAMPYDIPVVGYDNKMVNMLRVWSARSPKRIDMESFNSGQYVKAMAERELAEVVSKVLYPNDNSAEGRELRLKQQYFFAAASVRYAVKDFVKVHGEHWDIFSDKVAIHINDTHPAIAIPELMRVLMDDYALSWDAAEAICRGTFAYTNHTVMAEALEKWPEDLLRRQLPRIYMILEEMNRRLCAQLWEVYPGQWERIGHMAVLAYGQAHMANLAVAYSASVNGVSKIHTDIIKKQTFRDFYVMKPARFQSITNGITHRRWLIQSNPALSGLIDEAIGDAWRKEPARLSTLAPFADDAAFREQFDRVKRTNKLLLVERMQRLQGIALDPDSIFDTQAKRLHEYKRQLMNALRILMLYNRIDDNPDFSIPPVTFLFGAKASPGYYRAKLIIKLINAIGELVKKHPRASKLIKIAFIENYS
ncbi:MAG: glycogen/starch/alpha-glucan family phosphorylase, partial [Christensenellales bacterium]